MDIHRGYVDFLSTPLSQRSTLSLTLFFLFESLHLPGVCLINRASGITLSLSISIDGVAHCKISPLAIERSKLKSHCRCRTSKNRTADWYSGLQNYIFSLPSESREGEGEAKLNDWQGSEISHLVCLITKRANWCFILIWENWKCGLDNFFPSSRLD